MNKLFLIITLLFLFANLNAQNIRVQPNNPTNEDTISITTTYGCDVFTENMNHSINGFIVEFEVEVDTVENSIQCSFDPPPPLTFTYQIEQLPAGDYEFIFNTTDLVDMSVSQRSFFVSVGIAPAAVPVKTSLLILLILSFGFLWFKNN